MRTEHGLGFPPPCLGAALEVIGAFERAYGGISVQFRPNLGFTEIDVQRAVESVHHSVLGTAGVSNATTAFDYETRQITTVVVLEHVAGGLAMTDLREGAVNGLVDSGLSNLLDRVSVVVLESNLPTLGNFDTSSANIGGELLSDCTSGFSVKNSLGVAGATTSAHCQNQQSDDGHPLTFKAEHFGVHGDFQWMTVPQAAPDDFYAGSTTVTETDRRDVAAVGAPIVGQSLCKNGRTGYKDMPRGNEAQRLQWRSLQSRVDGKRAWRPGVTAVDLSTGVTLRTGCIEGAIFNPFWPFDRDVFARADRIDNALGVNVKTS